MAEKAVWSLTLLLVAFVANAAGLEEADTDDPQPSPEPPPSWQQLKNPTARRRCSQSLTASIEDFPSLVHLTVSQSEDFVCRGSVLTERWVLTAAHCVDKRSASILVQAGSTVCRMGQAGVFHESDFHVTHPKFQLVPYGPDPDNAYARYDIGLVHLSRPLQFTNRIQPVRRWPINEVLLETTDVTLPGCGCEVYGSAHVFSDSLTPMDMLAVAVETCGLMANNVGKFTDRSMLCAGNTDVSACSGDSGAPLFTQEGMQVGVASWVLAEGVSGPVENITFFADLTNKDIISWIDLAISSQINEDSALDHSYSEHTLDLSAPVVPLGRRKIDKP